MNEEGKSRSDISPVSPFGITGEHVVASNDRRKVVVRIEKEHFCCVIGAQRAFKTEQPPRQVSDTI
jgi:hypothetical protein